MQLGEGSVSRVADPTLGGKSVLEARPWGVEGRGVPHTSVAPQVAGTSPWDMLRRITSSLGRPAPLSWPPGVRHDCAHLMTRKLRLRQKQSTPSPTTRDGGVRMRVLPWGTPNPLPPLSPVLSPHPESTELLSGLVKEAPAAPTAQGRARPRTQLRASCPLAGRLAALARSGSLFAPLLAHALRVRPKGEGGLTAPGHRSTGRESEAQEERAGGETARAAAGAPSTGLCCPAEAPGRTLAARPAPGPASALGFPGAPEQGAMPPFCSAHTHAHTCTPPRVYGCRSRSSSQAVAGRAGALYQDCGQGRASPAPPPGSASVNTAPPRVRAPPAG